MTLYAIEFSTSAEKTVAKYKKSNQVVYKKLVKLLEELMQHPRTGTGHPEPLKGDNSVTYSRRLTANDRLVYDIYDEKISVLVISVEGHYDDK